MASSQEAAVLVTGGQLGHRLDRRVVEVYSHTADEVAVQLQVALKQSWLTARRALAISPTPPSVRPRGGRIRRQLTATG